MEYISIDQLIASAPSVISRGTLGNVKQSFQLAKYRAETCSFGEMIDNLLFVGQGIDDIVDELAHAFHKGKIESADYDSYIQKIEAFQWRTVPKTIKEALIDKCSCEAAKKGA
ncbi:unnamed protein product [marine sediment metagenome]|uniref:Uncharacterized protein n=1 Tax=marine sediment metagenome TaxID=412755 RepID=X1IGF7_9ZZZZ